MKVVDRGREAERGNEKEREGCGYTSRYNA